MQPTRTPRTTQFPTSAANELATRLTKLIATSPSDQPLPATRALGELLGVANTTVYRLLQERHAGGRTLAFNDPLPRRGKYKDAPSPPTDYRKLATRVVDLRPPTIAQNARTSGGGNVTLVPPQAVTVGPVETWRAEKVSIWQAGAHDNPCGQRLTTLMIAKGIADSAVPM